ncbi:MAG: hypothetical protein HC788_00115 [Sphingopyxis sp.]|nr:hypothetical protein [Sphingopyxis sp.]
MRNTFYNLLGLGLPLLVALFAIPVLIDSLGSANFGILTIIWAVVSYFGLFDLGLGRAVTQQIAATMAADQGARIGGIVGTASLLMLGLGISVARRWRWRRPGSPTNWLRQTMSQRYQMLFTGWRQQCPQSC